MDRDLLLEFSEKLDNEDLTFIEELESEKGKGGAEIYLEKETNIYYCIYGAIGEGFTDYCNVEKGEDKDKIIESVKRSLKSYD